MSLSRAEIVMEFYPRWKSTPALIELCEQSLRHYTPEQVRAATGQCRIENSSSSDPNFKAIVAQIRGDRVGKSDATGYHTTTAIVPIRPETESDRQFSRLMDTWRTKILAASKLPGFDWLKWREQNHAIAARDLREFEITMPQYVDHFIRRCGSEVGVGKDSAPQLSFRTQTKEVA